MLDLLVPVSGRERSEISTSATFMEQGFDSLSLTQVAFAIRKEFSAKVSFSQLMNQWPNVDLLAAHLDATLPVDILAEAPVIPAPLPVSPLPAAPSAVDARPDVRITNSVLEEVVADQARTIARLVTLLEKSGMNAPAANHPSVAAPADAADGDGASPVPTRQETAPPASGPREVEATVPQRGIFASSRLSERLSASYNESMTVRFTGNISIAKMTRAMERLVERHDALRARFDEAGLVMKIAPAQKIAMPVTDLSSINPPTGQEERLRKLIADETSLPFPRCSAAKWFCSAPSARRLSSRRTTSSAMVGRWMS